MSEFLKHLVFITFLFFLALSAHSAEMKRRVLVLWDSSDDPGYVYTRSHQHVEFVFNHLGYAVDPLDISKGVPSKLDMSAYHAIFGWFADNTAPQPGKWIRWLKKQVTAGKKVILFGDFPFGMDARTGREVPGSVINSFFSMLGLEYIGDYLEPPFLPEFLVVDSLMLGFERRFDGGLQAFERIRSKNPKNRIHLSYRLLGSPGSRSDAVTTTPQGGIAWGNSVLFEEDYGKGDKATTVLQWKIDPFLFLAEALGDRRWPVPDVNMKNGRRIYFSHIDGDGFMGFSSVDKKSSCGQLVLDSIIRRYKLPVSTSFISSELDLSLLGKRGVRELFEEYARSPYTELGSHTYSHPFVYNEEQASAMYEAYEGKLSLDVPGYGKVLMEKEIHGSLRTIDSLAAPFGKSAKLLLWSGNCQPDSTALSIVEREGYYNMNGGDGRFDRKYPSYANLSPLGRRVGPYYQVYTSNANETIYSNVWTGPFYAYVKVIETFRNTGAPRLVKPVNVYYHFYSADRRAGLDAVEKVMNWVETQALNPMRTTEYIDWVRGFHSAKIRATGKRSWNLSDYGRMRTLRIDTEQGVPDLSRSNNILGFRHFQGNLYLHLGAGKTTEIFLAEPDFKNTHPWLESSNADIRSWKVQSEKSLVFTFRSWKDPDFVFAGFETLRKISLTIFDAEGERRIDVITDKKGRARFSEKAGRVNQPKRAVLSWEAKKQP